MKFVPSENDGNNNNVKKYWWLRESFNTLFPVYICKTST